MKASQPEVVAAQRVNPGETLRKVRESKSLALGDVAAQLNLTAQALRNLEAGEFERLPGHTFARGYVRAYAKLMGLDPNRLVAEFDQYTGTDASGSSVSSLTRIEEPARVSQSLVKIFSIVALAALGGLGFYWWQGEHQRSDEQVGSVGIEHVEVESADGTTEIHPLAEPEDQAVAEAQLELPLAEVPPATEQAQADGEAGTPAQTDPAAAAPRAQASGEQAGQEAAPAAAQAPVAADQSAPAPAAEPANAAAAPTAPAAENITAPVAPAAGEAVVNLQFTADCWTQLTDADGKVLLSALKRRGDSVELVGKAPLELRRGYARDAVVLVNGQPVDVASSTHGETARLKLGQ